MSSEDLARLLQQAPETELIELLILDLNGCLRGKRIPANEFEAVFGSGFNIPGGSVLLDTLGDTCDDIVYGSADGDPDIDARVIAGSLAPTPWTPRSGAHALFTMFERDGSPYFADPRHVLAKAVEPIAARGLDIVMATELEFFLLEADVDSPAPRLPRIPGTNQRQGGNQTYSTDDLWDVEPFLAELTECCRVQELPISTVISEFAAGQYEVNLHHIDDPLVACDQAVLLKRTIKAIALRHGFAACFMAKPFAEAAGNGLHIHLSLVDQDGRNFFSKGNEQNASPALHAGAAPCDCRACGNDGRLHGAVRAQCQLLSPAASRFLCPGHGELGHEPSAGVTAYPAVVGEEHPDRASHGGRRREPVSRCRGNADGHRARPSARQRTGRAHGR